MLNLASPLRACLIRGGVGVGGCYAKHSLRWSGSKNKQGFLSLAPFTVRVMSLGPGGWWGGGGQQVWGPPPQAPDVT